MSSPIPSPPHRRRYDRVGGTVLALLGVAVAVVALVALRHPNGREASSVTLPSTTTRTVTAPPTAKPSPSTKPGSTSSAPDPATTAATPAVDTTSPDAALQSVPLIVLNNTTITDLAATAEQRFEAGGWTVSRVGNLVNDILSTCAYYDPSDPINEQAALALQQQFPEIKRVKEKFDGLPAGPIVVVLTTDYS